MFKLFSDRWRVARQRRAMSELRLAISEPRPHAEKPAVAARERHRLADTDGTLRRMRQIVEHNRLL